MHMSVSYLPPMLRHLLELQRARVAAEIDFANTCARIDQQKWHDAEARFADVVDRFARWLAEHGQQPISTLQDLQSWSSNS